MRQQYWRRLKPWRPLLLPAGMLAAAGWLTVSLGSLRGFDRFINDLVIRLPAQWEPLFSGAARLADPPVLVSVAAAVTAYEAWQRRWVRALAMLLSLVALPGYYAIKELVRRARPVSEFVTSHGLHDYSFPSGHSMGSAAVYGLVLVLVASQVPPRWRWVVGLSLLGLIFLVGLSRVFLGAHFPTDVIGGWLIGLTIVSLLRTMTISVMKWRAQRTAQPEVLQDSTEASTGR